MKNKVEEILNALTLEEKIEICEGKNVWETRSIERVGLPSIFMCDGPHGLRKQEQTADILGVNSSVPATCFPTAVTSGTSWDTELIERVGEAIGEEASAYGVSIVLGPGANIKRNPLCGRNFEYISEDPFVAGKMAAGLIRGIQKNGTAACLKHFACNNQELQRFQSDSIMDERTLREIYLSGFETAVKEGKPETIMCAYNKINGVHASDDKRLLTDCLRGEWGFDGLVMTDWGAMNDRIEGFKAGCDLNMPGGSDYMMKDCRKAVKAGTLSETEIDACARRVIALAIKERNRTNTAFDRDAHHAIARKAAEAGAVLLKNDNDLLPLKQGRKIAVIGTMAKSPRYQGAGSSHINPTRISVPLDFLPDAVFAPGYDGNGDTSDGLIMEAQAAAKAADVAVVFAGLPDRYESEGYDRDSMKMPEGHVRMIEAVSKANPNTVVVLLCGAAVECPWADQVKAILYMGLSGQAIGEAAANLLYGKANPSGKLTESWPMRYEDTVTSAYYGKKDAQYREGVYVGYRFYEKAGIPVRWPFGFGLSYTTYSYSDLKADQKGASVTVTNTGKYPGAEVVELFVKAPADSGYRPVRELRGFQKVFLAPGERKTVSFSLNDRSFAVWSEGWKVPKGIYAIEIGGLSADAEIDGIDLDLHRNDWYDRPGGTPEQPVWERMLGRQYIESIPKKGSFTMDDSVMEMKDYSLIMRIMYRAVENRIAKSFGGKKDYGNPDFKMLVIFAAGSPLRSMQIFSGMKGGVFKGLLDMANGHFFRGVKTMLEG